MKFNLNKNQISIIIEALQQEDTQESNDLINYIETQLQCYNNNNIGLSQLKI
jgi:hypothetical protein